MGLFSETTVMNNRLLFADQGKNLLFSFLIAENKQKFAVSVFCLQQTYINCLFHKFGFTFAGAAHIMPR